MFGLHNEEKIYKNYQLNLNNYKPFLILFKKVKFYFI